MQPEEVIVSPGSILGIPIDYVMDFDLDINQNGGSFTLTLVNELSFSIPTKVDTTIFGSLKGVVDDISLSKGNSGNLILVTGRVMLKAFMSIKPRIYISNTPWLVNSVPVDYLNDMSDFENDPIYKIIPDMTFVKLALQIANDNAVSIRFKGGHIDYKIYKFEVSNSSNLLSIFQQLAYDAGASAVYNNGFIDIIPWSYVGGSQDNIPLDDCLSDIVVTSVKSEYESIVLKSSDEITPYNSFYGGLPQKITSLTFTSGSISLKDYSFGSGVVRADKQWYFPTDELIDNPLEIAGKENLNLWYEVKTFTDVEKATKKAISNILYTNVGVESAWDYETFGSQDIDYKQVIKQYNNLPGNKYININEIISNHIINTNTYKVLLRWNRAQTLIRNTEDIHPIIYVLPDSDFPEELGTEQYTIPHKGELTLADLNNAPASPFSKATYPGIIDTGFEVPSLIVGSSPDGIGLEVKINRDKSFYLNMVFTSQRGLRKYPVNSRQTPIIDISAAFYTSLFSNANFVVKNSFVNVSVSSLPEGVDSLANHILNVIERTTARYIIPGTFGDSIPDVGSSVTPIANISTPEDDIFDKINFENWVIANSYQIVQVMPIFGPEGEEIPEQARLVIDRAIATEYSGPFSLGAAFKNFMSTGVMRASINGEYASFVDSGLVQDNLEAIEGSWSIYGLRRITTPATLLLGSGGNGINYSGINIERDQVFTSLQNGMKNPKVYESPLITDFMGNNSHIRRLGQAMLTNINKRFKNFSANFIARNNNLYTIGESIKVDGNVGQIVSYKIKISDQTMTKTVNCGAVGTL